jgi:hypothetical protein
VHSAAHTEQHCTGLPTVVPHHVVTPLQYTHFLTPDTFTGSHSNTPPTGSVGDDEKRHISAPPVIASAVSAGTPKETTRQNHAARDSMQPQLLHHSCLCPTTTCKQEAAGFVPKEWHTAMHRLLCRGICCCGIQHSNNLLFWAGSPCKAHANGLTSCATLQQQKQPVPQSVALTHALVAQVARGNNGAK